jgi:hypothetical protein
VPFEIVNEQMELLELREARLCEALAHLKSKLKLSGCVRDMATEIKRTAKGVSSLWDGNIWATHGDLLRPFIKDTEEALREHVHLKSARGVRQLANFIWSQRQNRRGRNQEINSDLLLAILQSVEQIAGRKVTYSRKRKRRAPLNAPATGPPEGAMMGVLLAALDWAYALPTPQRRSTPLKAEGVLSAVKRLRPNEGQN